MSVEEDRRELVTRLVKTQAAWRAMSGIPEVLRQNTLEAAFDALCCVAAFNKRHPESAIAPLR